MGYGSGVRVLSWIGCAALLLMSCSGGDEAAVVAPDESATIASTSTMAPTTRLTLDDVPSPTESPSTAPASTELVFDQSETMTPLGAILSMVAAGSVDPAGSPVAVSGNFTTASDQVSVVIDIGALAEPTAELIVSWFQLDGSTPLVPAFEHRIEVQAGDHAFSTGVSQGLLALGRYEVTAAVGSDSRSVMWMVSEEGSLADSPGFAPDAGRVPPSPGDPGSGLPPAAGESGAVHGAVAAAASAGGCGLSVVPLGLVSAWIDVTGCGGGSTVVGAGAAGAPMRVIETVTGDFVRPYGADPCRVGGSDLPYSEITFAARIDAGPHAGLAGSTNRRLGPDEAPPTVTVEATPPVRTQVFPGDTILLVIRVDDGISPGLGQTGVRDIRVTQADGTVVHEQQFGLQPTPCDKARLHQEIAVTVTVPADPEDMFWIDVGAGDFASAPVTTGLAWPTTTTWEGLMDATAHDVVTGDGEYQNDCTARWNLLITIPDVDGPGDVRGRAEVEPQQGPICVPWGVVGEYKGTHIMKVTGTFDGNKFALNFHSPIPAGGLDVALFILYYPELRTLVVPVNGHVAQTPYSFAQTGVTEGMGNGATLDGYITLRCAACSIDG